MGLISNYHMQNMIANSMGTTLNKKWDPKKHSRPHRLNMEF
ncbi:MAG: hypothetical protein RL179_1500 [Planctomycetota bacterium]|jgi:hypothetical protein